jgi:hypothetical protein
MLSDARQSLRTFDVFQAFRASTASRSESQPRYELTWDPPTGAAWDDATHVTRGLRGRADQLFQAITAATVDPDLWRERRDMADASRQLLDLGDALQAYRERLDVIGPGAAVSALDPLERAWAQWDSVAARFGLERSEAIACGG